MADLSKIRPCMLMYDIPERPAEGKERVPNPSYRLRRIAIRLQYSVWVIPEANMPYSLLEGMRANGATWDAVPFATDSAETLLRLARESLIRDMNKGVASLRKTMETAARLYAEGELSAKEAEDRINGSEKRLNALLVDLQKAAAYFDIDPSSLPVESSMETAKIISGKFHERAREYRAAAATLAGVSSFDAAALSAAAMIDELPANVLADAVFEFAGDEERAASLQEAFAPVEPELVMAGSTQESQDWYSRIDGD